MNSQGKRNRLVFAIACYLIGITLFSVYTYIDTQKKLVKIVDKKLLVSAHAANNFLGKDFHTNLQDENSISTRWDNQLAIKLKAFTEKIGIEYVYTMIKDGELIRFVTSSPTDEEVENNSYEKTYYTVYSEADKAIFKSFDTAEIQYAQYKDRWGEFRSVFIPMTSSDGTQYVVGADVSLNEINQIAYQSATRAFLVCLFLGFIGMPLILSYIRSVKHELQTELRRRFRDHLTSLPNRSSLVDKLDNCDSPSLAIVNINGFREITNIYGSDEGDNVLLQLKNRLLNYCEGCEFKLQIFRLHSDEFAVYTDDILTEVDFYDALDKLRAYIESARYLVNKDEIILNVTIGAVTQHRKALIYADMALREAKDKHESIVVYESELLLPERYQKNLQHAQILKEAIQKGYLIPYFQPIKNIESNQIEKYEVLARVVDGNGDIRLMPDDFIAVAARTRQYATITKTMLAKSIEVLKETADSEFKISVNIAISDIEDPITANYIIDTIESSNLGHRIEFELLESQGIRNVECIIAFIHKLKRYGVMFGIDDLGKDYSNFDRLMQLPVDFIKIDGSIMANILDSEDAFVMAGKIVEVAQHKHIKTIAEYCFSADVEKKARLLNVDYVQGFYIGKPNNTVNNILIDLKSA